jgi:hypothetical protein
LNTTEPVYTNTIGGHVDVPTQAQVRERAAVCTLNLNKLVWTIRIDFRNGSKVGGLTKMVAGSSRSGSSTTWPRTPEYFHRDLVHALVVAIFVGLWLSRSNLVGPPIHSRERNRKDGHDVGRDTVSRSLARSSSRSMVKSAIESTTGRENDDARLRTTS